MKVESLNEKVIDLIIINTGVDVRLDSRKRNIIELRSLYFTLIKTIDKKQTLDYLGRTVNRDHSSVLHNLKTYPIYEKYNKTLKPLKYKILSFFTIGDESEDIQNTYVNQIDFLKRLNSKLIDRLNIKNEEVFQKNKFEYDIIEKLNELLNNTKGTELHSLMLLRLESLYDMNSKINK